MPIINAPRFRTGRAADAQRTFNAGFGATNLQTVSGMPPWGPLQSDAHNGNGAANENVVYTTEDNVVHTVVLSPGETYPINVPIKSLSVSGATVQVRCYWYWNALPGDPPLVMPPTPNP